jgi:hypothetical protein
MSGVAFATAYDVTSGGATGIPANSFGPYTADYTFNAADYALNDTLDVIKIPEGAVVYGVNVEVSTADGETSTMDVGDSANATGYLSNVDLNSASTNSASLTFGGTAGKFYASGGKIRLTFDHAVEDAVFKVRATVIDVGSSSQIVSRAGAALQVLGTPGNQVIFTKYIDKVEVLSRTRALRSGERIPRGEWQRFMETWANFKRLADRTDIPEDVRTFIHKFGPPSVERYPAAYRIYRPHWYSRSRLFILWGLEPVGGAEFVSLTPEEAQCFKEESEISGDETPYILTDTYLSKQEFDDLPEFEGF